MPESKDNISCIRLLADPVQIQVCKNYLAEAERSFATLSKVLDLAGNEVRLKILSLLNREGELCPCDLSDILGMGIPAVSLHLRKLKDANLIQFRKEGQAIFYSLKSTHASVIQPLFQHIHQKEASKSSQLILMSAITCPECGHLKEEIMPTNACQYFYECENCKHVLKPKPGDCCVYCSYGTVKCPPKQAGEKSCCS